MLITALDKTMRVITLLSYKFRDFLRPYWQINKQFASWLQLQSKITYVKLKRLLIPASIPEHAGGKLNLHLGCGPVNHNKFINIDGYPFPHVHYVQSIDKLPQFEDESVDLVYASHCLEHFSYVRTKNVLMEWYRVLKKKGVLRLSVPDFDKLVEIYSNHQCDPDVILPQLMGGQNNKYNFHFTVLNQVNLNRFLKTVGFSKIRKWYPGTNELTSFNDFSIYKKEIEGEMFDISLNVEAIK